jgi:hypothetical protein
MKGVAHMEIEKAVQAMVNYLRDDGATLERRHGPEAATAAQDLVALLSARLQDESAYISLWDQFQVQPRQTADQLAGALEALLEADPALSRRMEAFLEEYQEASAGAASGEEETSEEEEEGTSESENEAYQPVNTPGDYSETGTYLYGNLSPGIASAGEISEVELLSEEGFDVEASAPDVSEVLALFQDLDALVEERAGAGPAVKQSVRAELEQMATDVAEGRDEDEEFIVNRLCAIEDLDPEIYRLVIEKLAGPEADFAPVVQLVAGRRLLDIA